MAKFYTEATIGYYNSDEEEEFTFSLILYARDSISAVKKITEEGIKLLKEETEFYKNIISFNIYTLYETTEDARI